MRLAGKTAMLSGAGGPMGRAVANRLVADGASALALTDISATRLAETCDLLMARAPWLKISQFRADVTVADEANAFCDQALDEIGQVDVLVNVVGGLRSKQLYTAFLDMSEDQWRATMDLNVMGGFHLIRRIAPVMQKWGYGRIINFASIVYGGEAGQADYAAAKAAVASMTRSLAEELAPAITVNCVAPGLTRTSVTRHMPEHHAARLSGQSFFGRMAEPEEIADAVSFLASEQARFVTGEILSVSGGIRPQL
ncbi:SDR family NAD(P)-dependent oxidoreductase [Actibacterium sp.]|uniref:SDR family NAD(P)-dependent oxidoreductase n=1 Tax=Actibacterium sp. TaxID=1872125 RepID=UPI003564D78E